MPTEVSVLVRRLYSAGDIIPDTCQLYLPELLVRFVSAVCQLHGYSGFINVALPHTCMAPFVIKYPIYGSFL